MAVRKFWKRHPILLRVTAVTLLLLAPLSLLWCVAMVAWDNRNDIKAAFKEVWQCAVYGEIR